MPKNLNDLAISLEKRAKAVEKSASTIATNLTISIVAILSNTTPVDTSKALSNWTVTLDAPTDAEIEARVLGSFGSSQAASAEETLQAAKKILSKKKPGQAIFIRNNAKYIKSLNDGSSAQAPAGFVESAVLTARKLKRIKF